MGSEPLLEAEMGLAETNLSLQAQRRMSEKQVKAAVVSWTPMRNSLRCCLKSCVDRGDRFLSRLRNSHSLMNVYFSKDLVALLLFSRYRNKKLYWTTARVEACSRLEKNRVHSSFYENPGKSGAFSPRSREIIGMISLIRHNYSQALLRHL